MIHSTTGILLHTIKHSDSSAVLHVFTRDFGRKAYFLRGLSKKKNSPRSILFPLSILELQVTDRDNKSLQQINEVSMHKPTFELLSNPVKSSIAIFLNEVLHRSIEVNYHNEVLYDFLENAIQLLDSCDNVKNFHLWFMLELSKYFGFYPMKKGELHSAKFQFELESGTFTDIGGCSGAYIDVSTAAVLDEILGMKFDELSSLGISSFDRKTLLHGLVDYFIIHVPNLKRVSSLEVLETVFEF